MHLYRPKRYTHTYFLKHITYHCKINNIFIGSSLNSEFEIFKQILLYLNDEPDIDV